MNLDIWEVSLFLALHLNILSICFPASIKGTQYFLLSWPIIYSRWLFFQWSFTVLCSQLMCMLCLFFLGLFFLMAVPTHPSLTQYIPAPKHECIQTEITHCPSTHCPSRHLATSMSISLPYCFGYLPIFTLEFSVLPSHEILRHHFAFLFLAWFSKGFEHSAHSDNVKQNAPFCDSYSNVPQSQIQLQQTFCIPTFWKTSTFFWVTPDVPKVMTDQ